MKQHNDKKEVPVSEELNTVEEDVVEAEVEAIDASDDADDLPEMEVDEDSAAVETDPLALELAALTAERDELKDQALRARAEFDNYRKRMARESDRIRKTAAEGLMRDLLPVVDNLERALAHVDDPENVLAQGVGLVVKQFADVLGAQGLEPIPAKGEAFDPNVHEALTHQPSEEIPADHVLEEFQRGYRVGDFVLRPAQVVVSSGPPAASEAAVDSEAESANEESDQ